MSAEKCTTSKEEFRAVDTSDLDFDDAVEGSGRNSRVARAADNVRDFADNFGDFAEGMHEKRIDFQNDLVESIKDRANFIKENAQETGGKALSFFQKVGEVSKKVGKTIGLVTLGAAVMGVEAGAKVANHVKESASEAYSDGKQFASDKVESGKQTINNTVESVKGFAGDRKAEIVEVINACKDKKAEAVARIDARRQAREDRRAARAEIKAENAAEKANQKAIEAREKALDVALQAKFRMADREARRLKIEEIKGSVVDSINEKKGAIAERKEKIGNGVSNFAESALNFFKKARQTGQAAYEAATETWNSYDQNKIDDNPDL